MGPLFETIRSRLLVGLAVLMAGLLGTVALGAATLRLMQQAVATELAALQASSEVGSGIAHRSPARTPRAASAAAQSKTSARSAPHVIDSPTAENASPSGVRAPRWTCAG